MLAVNDVGHESGVPTMADLGDLPLLQNTTLDDVWTSWGSAYRDVVLLDDENYPIEVFNLTLHDLNDPVEYQALSDLITAELTPE